MTCPKCDGEMAKAYSLIGPEEIPDGFSCKKCGYWTEELLEYDED